LNKYYLFNYYNYLFNKNILNSNIVLKDNIFTNIKLYVNNLNNYNFESVLMRAFNNFVFDKDKSFLNIYKDINLLDMKNYNNLYNLYNYYDINNLLIKNLDKNKQKLLLFFNNKKKINVKFVNILKSNILKAAGLNYEKFMSVESVAITADQVGKDKKQLANLIKTESLDYIEYIKNSNIKKNNININIIDEVDLYEYKNYLIVLDKSYGNGNIYPWLFNNLQDFIFKYKKSYIIIQINFIKEFIMLYKKNVLINKVYFDNTLNYHKDIYFNKNNTYYFYKFYINIIYNIYFYLLELKYLIDGIYIDLTKIIKFDYTKVLPDFKDFQLIFVEKKMSELNYFAINLYDNTSTKLYKNLNVVLNEEYKECDDNDDDNDKEEYKECDDDLIVENNLLPYIIIK